MCIAGQAFITLARGYLPPKGEFGNYPKRKKNIEMVFVLDASKRSLYMCHPAKARKLLKNGDAAIYRREPFTIILKKEVPEEPEQIYRLKIDYGSRHTGLAILKDNEVCWLGQLEHRTDIKDKLDKRRGYRRRRRVANLRYRKARFDNRVRESGWLPPSLVSRVDNIQTFISRLKKIVPLGYISYENVKFDTQLMENPDIKGVSYQQGTLMGYEMRQYLLEKYDHQCVYCGAKNVPLEVEHLVPKSRGGTNRVLNLAISCRDCNQKKGSLTAEEFGYPELMKNYSHSLRDAAAVTATRWKVYEMLLHTGVPVECGTGGRTKFNRTRLELPKEHYYDAICIGASTPDHIYLRTNVVHLIKAIGRGKHQRTNVNASGFPRGYLARQKRFFGFQTGDMIKAVVPSGKKAGTYYGRVACRKSGSFDINTISGRIAGINHKYISLIQRNDGYQYGKEERSATSFPYLKAWASVA